MWICHFQNYLPFWSGFRFLKKLLNIYFKISNNLPFWTRRLHCQRWSLIQCHKWRSETKKENICCEKLLKNWYFCNTKSTKISRKAKIGILVFHIYYMSNRYQDFRLKYNWYWDIKKSWSIFVYILFIYLLFLKNRYLTQQYYALLSYQI